VLHQKIWWQVRPFLLLRLIQCRWTTISNGGAMCAVLTGAIQPGRKAT
jgi:hypothetical protein